ncbi:MAG: DUF5721 family protein [Lachnospiraceae bacterium]|nr:DUF5721 family protein [Lachnospiraceae bacterium]
MQSLQISDVKDFMNKLLVSDAFDAFLLSEASLTTFTTFHIDGSFHRDYFSFSDEFHTDGSDTADRSETTVAASAQAPQNPSWKMVKPLLFGLIRGKNTPLHFKIVFRLADYNVEKLLVQSGVSLQAADVNGLFLNIVYNGKEVSCITGTSLRLFTLDKTLEHSWDEMVHRFLRQKGIVSTHSS